MQLTLAAPAFLAPAAPAVGAMRAAPCMGIESMEGVGPETGNKIFDPLDLANSGSEDTLAWMRHAEIKHGRVAMAAFLGWLWVDGGAPLFAGKYSYSGATFESLGHDSFAAWDALPSMAKLQIFLVIGGLEFFSETEKPHYTQEGGVPGKVTVFGGLPLAPSTALLGQNEEKKAYKRLSEIKNGRLAMIGIMGVISEHFIPGSVPLVK